MAHRGVKRRGWIVAAALVAVVVVAVWPGFDYWRGLLELGPTSPAQRPAPAGPHSCPGLPKDLDGAFGDAGDCALFERTLMQALATAEAGTLTRWTNLKSGVSGTIKLGAAESREGSVCRRAELAVTRHDGTKRAQAVACLKGGAWIIVQ